MLSVRDIYQTPAQRKRAGDRLRALVCKQRGAQLRNFALVDRQEDRVTFIVVWRRESVRHPAPVPVDKALRSRLQFVKEHGEFAKRHRWATSVAILGTKDELRTDHECDGIQEVYINYLERVRDATSKEAEHGEGQGTKGTD